MAVVRLIGSEGSAWELLLPDVQEEKEVRKMAEPYMLNNGGDKVTWKIVEIVSDSEFQSDPEQRTWPEKYTKKSGTK